MTVRVDVFDLGSLSLGPGEGRRLELDVALGELVFSGQGYRTPVTVPCVLDVSRMTGRGYSLRLRLRGSLRGACMRCLEPAQPEASVDAREVDAPGGVDELQSPYVDGDELDLARWAHDAYALALPAKVVCRPECLGLCPQCGANLNEDSGHAHEAPPDPRWAKLRELEL